MQLLARWAVGVRVPVTAPGPGCGARTGAETPGTLGLSVNDGKRPWEAKKLSVKGLLPFRFRYAAVPSKGGKLLPSTSMGFSGGHSVIPFP